MLTTLKPYGIKIKPLLWGGLICFFTLQMMFVVWPYTSWKWDVNFLMTKQLIIHLDHYRFSFYAHIFSSLFVMASGAFLFSNYILRKYPKMHRYLGKLYVGLVLLVSAPSGLVMAYYANGGWIAQTSFVILSVLWWWFTYQGYRTARKLDFQAHKKWMMRSFALTLSAVTLRLFQMFLGYLIYMDPVTQYIFISWTSWIFNLLLVELWMIRRLVFARLSSLFLSSLFIPLKQKSK